MIRSDKQHLFPEREGADGWGGVCASVCVCRCVCEKGREREKDRKKGEAMKPVKLRQQGPACKKVKGGSGGVYCNVTQWKNTKL